MTERKYQNEDWLKKELKSKTVTQIAEENNVTVACISKWKRRYELGSKSRTKCPSCGEWFLSLGNHWEHNPKHRPQLSTRQKEIITGVLMGDGCINREEKKEPRLQVYMTNGSYLEYLDNIFGVLSTGVRDHMTAEESFNSSRFSKNLENHSDVYRLQTRQHPGLDEFSQWYSSGEKVFPEEIELTPTVLKHWYVCDGCFDNNGHNFSITISCCNEIGNKDKLEKYFNSEGFVVGYFNSNERQDGSVRFSINFDVETTKKLFDYMGQPLPGFEYKWPR